MTIMPAEPEAKRTFTYHVIRYAPNPVRDEWLNIGILTFDPGTGDRRVRLIESEDEYARVRRLHPQADEALLRGWRDELQNRFEEGSLRQGNWREVLGKLESTLSVSIQIAPQKGVHAADLDAETDRLYADHVTQRRAPSVGAPGNRATIRSYCAQVWKLAQLWDKLERSVRVSEFTFPGDPMRLDYAYRRNGTRGYVQTLSVSRSPVECKAYAYTAARIAAKARFPSEFSAVTDIPLQPSNQRHAFVRETLRDAGIEPVPMEGFAVWVNKLKPMMS
jgi:hypothetical protein